MRACSPHFYISGTVGSIGLKFCVWLRTNQLRGFHERDEVHVRTCTPTFCISGMARPIMSTFGMWFETGQLIGVHKSSEVPSHRSARAIRTRSFIANKASYWYSSCLGLVVALADWSGLFTKLLYELNVREELMVPLSAESSTSVA